MGNLQVLFSAEMLSSALRLTIPLALAALGTTIIEKSGVINLGVEGIMLLGAFFAVFGVHYSGSPFVGMILSIIIGALIGALYAVFVLRFNSNQSVLGIGLNIFASGLTVVLTRSVWGSEGLSESVSQIKSFQVPVLSKIPFLGAIFKNVNIYYILMFVFVVFTTWFINKTKYGLRLRSVGENEAAAETVGIPVKKYQFYAIVVSGMLAALGGSYLSIVQNNRFVTDMVAGRGFMAIAANIFGNQTPIGSMLASFVFAFAQAIRINLEVNIPDQFLQMLPYILTLLAIVILSIRKKIRMRKLMNVKG